ncbi:predicted protein [Histoplasma capsulatum G186AR]|uniref:Uncharacterized protein n=1 Tax=Ajellomyces capsulatus (strain G186AR / H82 / ATCC MYA-2454 / RMSCC 2432) TaxID=447093 RepID=C0NYV6_AJECG|nr:uncharacterized protein HCBG_08336 [Histoplasma capsulatum G186AR]EEH03395.1 predicted protein [Histoplasma capsulatum G186AR]
MVEDDDGDDEDDDGEDDIWRWPWLLDTGGPDGAKTASRGWALQRRRAGGGSILHCLSVSQHSQHTTHSPHSPHSLRFQLVQASKLRASYERALATRLGPMDCFCAGR